MSLNDQATLPTLTHVSAMQPASQSAAWLSAPHPRRPWVATCGADRAVRIYSLSSFTELWRIAGGHSRSVRTCAWKPFFKAEAGGKGGAAAAGGGEDDDDGDDYADAVAGDGEQPTLATGSFDSTVGVWVQRNPDAPPDAGGGSDGGGGGGGGGSDGEDEESEESDTFRFALVLDGHDSEVKSVAWSSGGNLLATCGRDKTVWVWEEVAPEDFETVAVLQDHSGDVKCVAWHPTEELLASGAYDDEVRLWRDDGEDWVCVGVMRGHDSTVWCVEWEGQESSAWTKDAGEGEQAAVRKDWLARREAAGPRLASSSADGTIKIWRRKPRERPSAGSGIPSTIRTDSSREYWVEEVQLPKMHYKDIYSISWSKQTGKIASTGVDGSVIVYEERWKNDSKADAMEIDATAEGKQPPEPIDQATEWVVAAVKDEAHGMFEVNHVVWAQRADKDKRKQDEEVLVTTGDDGGVNVWTME